MDRASTTTPVSHTELPAELRARAAHARRRARTLIFYEVEPELLAFADELDARAKEMNRYQFLYDDDGFAPWAGLSSAAYRRLNCSTTARETRRDRLSYSTEHLERSKPLRLPGS